MLLKIVVAIYRKTQTKHTNKLGGKKKAPFLLLQQLLQCDKWFTSYYHALVSLSELSFFNILTYRTTCGPGSSVGIATDYGLDDPGSNPGGDEIIRSSRPNLGSTQLAENGYRVFPGGKVLPGRSAADHSPPSSPAVIEV